MAATNKQSNMGRADSPIGKKVRARLLGSSAMGTKEKREPADSVRPDSIPEQQAPEWSQGLGMRMHLPRPAASTNTAG